MEILLGAIISVISQIVKRIQGKIGGPGTLILVFVFCFIGVFVYEGLLVNYEVFIKHMVTVFLSAVGFYEVVLRRIPVIGKDE
jgi:hypothetical protein